MWNSIAGRNSERLPYDGTRKSAPCADGRHGGCQDVGCSCADPACPHAPALTS